MSEWKQYSKASEIEAMPWTPDFDMSELSSEPKDPPKKGDMIARNPKDRDDMWLVSMEYFRENYSPVV
jgi:hypothetical protein